MTIVKIGGFTAADLGEEEKMAPGVILCVHSVT